MLELKKVSKYYYNKGVISSGFSNVSLKFEMGEFVAITGESGSGKSTLLNVISGLDTYEDGELYINGEETSHYTQKDYEIYRRKYIGNIFQNFNLVNSYTVYQNIELVLLLKGNSKRNIKNKVLDIIKEVNMYKYRNTKVSKLSGGQKQRVAIARALASNTPIILADEPTGNLDKESSISVLKLLHKISKDKLVIVVTHNYDQIEEYVTRKITMSDGKVLEDKEIKKYDKVKENKNIEYKDITFFNKIRLAFRNAFNILPKFLLIFAVYTFILFALFFTYSTFEETKYTESMNGFNNFFYNSSSKRIVLRKNDRSAFSEEDFKSISNLDNIDYISKNDIITDSHSYIYNDNEGIYFYGYIKSLDNLKSVDYGRMPTNENEVVVGYYDDELYMGEDYYLDKTLYIDDNYNNKLFNVKIVGFVELSNKNNYNDDIYFSNEMIEKISNNINKNYTTIKYTFNGNEYVSENGYINYEILPSSSVKKGIAIIPEEWTYLCKNYDCSKNKLVINSSNIYYSDTLNMVTSKSYNKDTLKKLTGYDYNIYNGAVFINEEEYNSLFNKGYYQSSVFVLDDKEINNTKEELNKLGFDTLIVSDTFITSDLALVKVLTIIKSVSVICLLFVLFFISYFIIKLVIKSRNKYFSTLRILGASYDSTKSLLRKELFVISSISYIVFIIFVILVKYSIINNETINSLMYYLTIREYVLLFILITLISLLLSNRFSRKLFKDSAMNTYREEV